MNCKDACYIRCLLTKSIFIGRERSKTVALGRFFWYNAQSLNEKGERTMATAGSARFPFVLSRERTRVF